MIREESRKRGVEGFMLKKKDSIYQAGRVKGAWYKWKIDPFVADMVVVSAQLGHGEEIKFIFRLHIGSLG